MIREVLHAKPGDSYDARWLNCARNHCFVFVVLGHLFAQMAIFTIKKVSLVFEHHRHQQQQQQHARSKERV
jgi:hypothetical protein